MSKPPAPSDAADKFMLRMPDGMRDRIAELARANKRSMNAEIVARLEASVRVDDLLNAKEEELNSHQKFVKVIMESANLAEATGKRIRIEISYPDENEMDGSKSPAVERSRTP